MDLFGLIRRGVGALGVGLVAFGVASQEEGAALSSNVEAIIGGIMFLADFVPSVFKKIGGVFGGSDAK